LTLISFFFSFGLHLIIIKAKTMKVILSFLLVISLSNLTTAQTTAIPDANFEFALYWQGYDVILDGFVSTAVISNITNLSVNGFNINDLTGIEDFISLTELQCFDNNLTSINLSQNTALTTLLCENNQLTNLDVSQNPALTTLLCYNNQLTSLNLIGANSLSKIFFWDNNLTSLDVSQNLNLSYLLGSHNQLTNLDVTQNIALDTLICDYNPLISVDVTQNIALKYFGCGYASLTSIDFSQNIALENLYIVYNQLTNIDVSQNINLKDLRCNNNQISSINVNGTSALEIFDCKFNQLTTLDLSQNSNLYAIYCAYNQLTCLNIKNGNNTNIAYIDMRNNTNLTCVEVDDVSYASSNNYFVRDIQTYYSTWCNNACSVGMDENSLPNISLYPNPTTGKITIDLGGIKQYAKTTLINSLGQVLLTQNYGSTNYINLELVCPKGMYFLTLETDGEVITKKIIKN